MVTFQLVTPERGRGASPNRPGIFVFRYLAGHTISHTVDHQDLSVHGRSPESMSELHRKYKYLYKHARLKHTKGKRRVATYHSFNAYFQRLIRMRWVELVREEISEASQITGGRWSEHPTTPLEQQEIAITGIIPPTVRPRRKFYRLTDLGSSLPLNYWSWPQYYYRYFMAGETRPRIITRVPAPRPEPVIRVITPPRVFPALPEAPAPAPRPEPVVRVRRIHREEAPPIITMEEIARKKAEILEHIDNLRGIWRARPEPDYIQEQANSIKSNLESLINQINTARRVTHEREIGPYAMQRQPIADSLSFFDTLENQLGLYRRETLPARKATLITGIYNLLVGISRCCR